jgi:L-ascorbate metabolism protein UlaG (beta-lactamase superfamily)
MNVTRRETLSLGLAAFAALGFPLPGLADEQGTDRYHTESGAIMVHPITHASVVITVPGLVIYTDPIGGADLYKGQQPPDLILLTHEHPDHFDPDTLSALAGEKTRLVANPAVFKKLPERLKSKANAIGNGEHTTVGPVDIEAIPAYNSTPDRLKFHPKGRDNGYMLTFGKSRIYIAGDTEDIPEMRALKDIFIAFVPMNLPYTMDVDQASSAVVAFAPRVVYPYHYKGSDPSAFAAKLAQARPDIKVVLGKWY